MGARFSVRSSFRILDGREIFGAFQLQIRILQRFRGSIDRAEAPRQAAHERLITADQRATQHGQTGLGHRVPYADRALPHAPWGRYSIITRTYAYTSFGGLKSNGSDKVSDDGKPAGIGGKGWARSTMLFAASSRICWPEP